MAGSAERTVAAAGYDAFMSSRGVDPKLARFLERNAVSIREEVEADVAPYRGKSPEECWAVTHSLARTAAWLLSLQPDPAKIVEQRDPPHPTYEAVMQRLRAARRNRR